MTEPIKELSPIACAKAEINLSNDIDAAIWKDACVMVDPNIWSQICIDIEAIELLEAIHPKGKSLLTLLVQAHQQGCQFLILELDQASRNRRRLQILRDNAKCVQGGS